MKLPLRGCSVYPRPTVSEVAGLLGGVADDSLRRNSESAERAIGDAMSVLFGEVLDTTRGEPGILVFLGPALPKIVGRLAAFRPPSNLTILWLTPIPFPECIAPTSQITAQSMLSQIANRAGDTPSTWEDEPLIVNMRYMRNDSEFLIQQLQMLDHQKSREFPANEMLNSLPDRVWSWPEGKLAVPRDLRLASRYSQPGTEDILPPEELSDWTPPESFKEEFPTFKALSPSLREKTFRPYKWVD